MNRRFDGWCCLKPYEWMEITPDGDVYVCCPTWLNVPIGNVFKQSFEEIWNSVAAQRIRQSVIDGSFTYCHADICPSLVTCNGTLRKREDVGALPVSAGPKIVNCSFDQSCNLACPSCRKKRFIATGKSRTKVDNIYAFIDSQLASTVEELRLLGSGDPFGSPATFAWLKSFDRERYPRLKNIHLHTNAQLFNEKTWAMISHLHSIIHTIEVSVDSASETTYRENRRGGDFKRLMANLRFISQLRKQGKLNYVSLCFVVQDNNFREIPIFSQMREKLGFDNAYFSQLINWGTFSEAEYLNRAVHMVTHPHHAAFVDVMRQQVFSSVTPGNSTNIDFNSTSDSTAYVHYVARNRLSREYIMSKLRWIRNNF